jgi:hypothetical protein
MKYFQPSYVRVAQKFNVKALFSRLGEYQSAFRFCLYAHAYTDGAYQADAQQHNLEHHEETLKNAMQHVEEVFDTLDINTYDDYMVHLQTILHWFGATVYRDGVEFVLLNDLWYERHWKKATVKAPTSKGAVLFWRDYARESADAVGLAVALDGKKIQTLQYGRGMENQSKKILSTAGKFLRAMKDKDDPAELRRRMERIHSIDDQFHRERTEMINKATKEILGHSRYVTFCGPLNKTDAEYYRRCGFDVLADFLKLVEVMTRNEANPVKFVEYDTAMLLFQFEESNQMHTDFATALSKLMVPSAKARKTVK